MITQDQVEKALDYLRDTSKEVAYWRGRVLAAEYKVKMVEAQNFLEVESGAQEYKKSIARASDSYKEAVDEWEEATVKFMELQSLRKAAEMRVSYYQSAVKAQTQGVII